MLMLGETCTQIISKTKVTLRYEAIKRLSVSVINYTI